MLRKSQFLRTSRQLKMSLLFFAATLFTSILQAQPDYAVAIDYCVYEGATYRIYSPTLRNYFECNPDWIVKWKVYSQSDNGDCQVESVTYGTRSPECLCDGVLRLELMSRLCLDYCEDFQLPPCRSGSGFSSKSSQEDQLSTRTTPFALCSDPCGSESGETCGPLFPISLNIDSYCFNGGIDGTLVNADNGEELDCLDNYVSNWKHWVPNPDYPGNSTSEFIINASGSGSDVGTCLCGGQLQVLLRNACCDATLYYFPTPDCPGTGGGGSSGKHGIVDQSSNLGEPSIFPNPTSNFFTLDLNTAEEINVNVQLMSTDGKILKELHNLRDVRSNISVDDLPIGVYWVRVHGSMNFTQKLIIR
ncbi:MAG: T9SS type A sorting domain-containing protein [Bacteroidota bacterium]